MLLAPGGNFKVVYLTEPEVSVRVARTVVPSRNWTLPVGVPADDETRAVKVTGFPDTEGLIDESSVVVVVAWVTVTCTPNELLPAKLLSLVIRHDKVRTDGKFSRCEESLTVRSDRTGGG